MNQRTKLFGQTFYGRWYVTDDGASGGVASSPAFRFTTFGPHGTTVLAAKTQAATSAALHLYGGWPNPFSAFTTVRFDLPSASRARLVVFDVSGRRVRMLYDHSMAAPGTYSVDWDGRDDEGHVVAGGIYFYRLETDRGRSTARVVRLD